MYDSLPLPCYTFSVHKNLQSVVCRNGYARVGGTQVDADGERHLCPNGQEYDVLQWSKMQGAVRNVD